MTASLSRSVSTTGKSVFLEQNNKGIGVWSGQFTELRIPKLFNLRSDPFERGDESILYNRWMAERAFVQIPMQGARHSMAAELQGVSNSSEARELQTWMM